MSPTQRPTTNIYFRVYSLEFPFLDRSCLPDFYTLPFNSFLRSPLLNLFFYPSPVCSPLRRFFYKNFSENFFRIFFSLDSLPSLFSQNFFPKLFSPYIIKNIYSSYMFCLRGFQLALKTAQLRCFVIEKKEETVRFSPRIYYYI